MAALDGLLRALIGARAPLRIGLGADPASLLTGAFFGGRRRRRLRSIGGIGALAAIAAAAYNALEEANEVRRSARERKVVRNETIVRPSDVRPEERLPHAAATPERAPSHDEDVEPPPLPPVDSPYLPADAAEEEALEVLLLRAMIAAAHADGSLDEEESARVLERLDASTLPPERREEVRAELRRPASIDALAAAVTRPEVAAEVYMASLLAITLDRNAERTHLQRLARALKLEDGTVRRLHAALEEHR